MEHVLAAARHVGIELSAGQLTLFDRYAGWLAGEAQRAGGIGPSESNRLERRHLADSLLFATGVRGVDEIWDLGTGVGLPGIPLAIALPEIRFVLIDRSRRRIDLLRRVIRILDLGNCEVRQGEIAELEDPVGAIVARASLSPPEMLDTANRLLIPGGWAVMGGSWQRRPEHPGWQTLEIPGDVLDHTVWLLIMRRE